MAIPIRSFPGPPCLILESVNYLYFFFSPPPGAYSFFHIQLFHVIIVVVIRFLPYLIVFSTNIWCLRCFLYFYVCRHSSLLVLLRTLCNPSERRSSLSGARTFAYAAHMLIYFENCSTNLSGAPSLLLLIFRFHSPNSSPCMYRGCAVNVPFSCLPSLIVDKVTIFPLHTSASSRHQSLQLPVILPICI